MSGTAPRFPEKSRSALILPDYDFAVSELAADCAGGLSPFGPDNEFPWPVQKLFYRHPRPEDRPNLADGR